ncbi:MAG: hypothetical protein ABH877_04280 [bacterium]
MDLKNLRSFDPEQIGHLLIDLAEKKKAEIDQWREEKIAELKDAADGLAVLSENLGGLLERADHIFTRTIDFRHMNTGSSGIPGMARCDPDLRFSETGAVFSLVSEHCNSWSRDGGPMMSPAKYRVFLIMEKVE